MADGVDETTDLIAQGEASSEASVFSGSDEFGNGGHEPVGSQRAGLFEDTFFGREIDDATNEQVRDILSDLLGRLILEDPFVVVVNKGVLFLACFDGEHGNVAGIHSE